MANDYVKRFISFCRIPKIQVGIFLSLIALSAMVFGQQSRSIYSILFAVGVTIAVDYVLIKLRKLKPFLLSAAIVSGIIIGLLTLPELPWYYFLIVAILAVGSKNFLKANNRHVFNPAAFGLFFAGLIMGEHVSWWGVIFQNIQPNFVSILLFILILIPAYVSMYKQRKTKTVLTFLAVFIILQFFIRGNWIVNLRSIFLTTLYSPLILFFSVVMLPEPMTSPNNAKLQILYGAFVGIVATLANFIPYLFIPDTLLLGLLAGNLAFFWLRQKYP